MVDGEGDERSTLDATRYSVLRRRERPGRARF